MFTIEEAKNVLLLVKAGSRTLDLNAAQMAEVALIMSKLESIIVEKPKVEPKEDEKAKVSEEAK